MERVSRRRFLSTLGAAGTSLAAGGQVPSAWGQADPIAPISEADAKAIIKYLTAAYGPAR